MPKAFRHLATGYQKAESSYIRNKLSGYVPSHYQNMLTPRSTTILQTSYTLHDSSGRGPVKGWNSMAPNSCARKPSPTPWGARRLMGWNMTEISQQIAWKMYWIFYILVEKLL